MEEKKILPIGTKVFDAQYGWGEVSSYAHDSRYPINCKFDKANPSYTSTGYLVEGHKSPMLSLTEYSLEKGGFTPITEFDFNAPKVVDWGYFWDNEEICCVYYGRLEAINNFNTNPYLIKKEYGYKNFSKEIPEHIKKLQENQ